MNNRFKLSAIPEIARPPVEAFPALKVRSKLDEQQSSISRVTDKASQIVMTAGILAFSSLVLMFFRPDFIDHLKPLSPFNNQAVTTAQASELTNSQNGNGAQAMLISQQSDRFMNAAEKQNKSDTNAEQKRVAEWLAKRYRIAGSGSKLLVEGAYNSAQDVRIDPLLVLAVMAIESRMNPYAVNVSTQNIIPTITKTKLKNFPEQAESQSDTQPLVNIKIGTQILKEYVQRGGSIEGGLKLYVGAAKTRGDRSYSARVMAEYRLLQSVSKGQAVPVYDPPMASPENGTLREASAEGDKAGKKGTVRKPA